MGTTVCFFPVQRCSGQEKERDRLPPATNQHSGPPHFLERVTSHDFVRTNSSREGSLLPFE